MAVRFHGHFPPLGQGRSIDAQLDRGADVAAQPGVTAPAYQPIALERTRPQLDATDSSPVEARRRVAPLLKAASLDVAAAEDLTLAVSEVVTNARLYGEAPVTLRGWVTGGQVVVTVTDCGSGPVDSGLGAGPLPRRVGEGGLGLWVAHQACDELVMGSDDRGFTVRLITGTI
jgi:anti-sigma regulatory factor (Ser/Thr protein kinase)